MTRPRTRSTEGEVEGSLTIRIPRHLGAVGKSFTPTNPPPSSQQQQPSATGSPSRVVGKSRSLTKSMDKLSTTGTGQRRPLSRGSSSRESSFLGGSSSRVSTPSSIRSTTAASPRPPSRRSVHSFRRSPNSPQRKTSPPLYERCSKSYSPTNSEVSSQSVHSSTHSINSYQSVPSVASSGRASLAKSQELLSSSNTGGTGMRWRRASSEPRCERGASCIHGRRTTGTPVKEHSKSVSPAALLHGPSRNKLQVPMRSSASASSLHSSSGDAVRLNESETPNKGMSGKSTNPPKPRASNIGGQRHGIGSTPTKKPLRVFNSYMSLFQVQEKLKKGEVIEGVLRINPKSYEDAYISAPAGGMDIYIGGVPDRNTALHGDVVAVLFNPQNEWKIFHAQLEEYLEEHKNLKSLVYSNKPLEPDISYTSDASFDFSKPVTHNTNLETEIASEYKCNIDNEDCDVVIEGDGEQEDQEKKKKKHRRGKKKKKRSVVEAVIESAKACDLKAEEDVSLQAGTSKSLCAGNIIIVPPDQLSECELSDNDDESVKSLSLEYEDKLAINSGDRIFKNVVICGKESLDFGAGGKNKESGSSSKMKKKQNLKEKRKSKNEKKAPGNETAQKSAHKTKESKSSPKQDTIVSQEKSNSELSIEQVMKIPDWQKFIQRTGSVVYILERKHNRLAAGILKQFADKNPHMALFSPFDYRIPRMKIPTNKYPPNFLARPSDFAKTILMAKITDWNHPSFAFGEICRKIGEMGNIEAETEALLIENAVDSSEFPDSTIEGLPSMPWTIPEEEIAKRVDLRKSVIFTIDPSTARDLDDAMSLVPLPNGNFRVGVHIADVSYFVKLNSELDEMASERATSVYLTQKVIPMLPRQLCETLCSLNPGEDRLAFSVVWELTPKGKVKGEWFGRTVIRSCVKLSYEHAQSIIENEKKGGESLNPGEFPEIYDGHSLKEVVCSVLGLDAIAKHLRKQRLQNGALRLDQIKVGFTFDLELKTPNGIVIHEYKDSNKLIEEFMLLANIAVAHKIHKCFPKLALLRSHPPPHDVQMDNALKLLRENNIFLDASSSKSLSDSINRYNGTDSYSVARMQLIVNLCSKPMQFARYFCSGLMKNESSFHHYALNVPLYTHFTSPIRRYPDVVVHRMLAAAINPEERSEIYRDTVVGQIADHCNTKKQAAKIVQETSCELHLALFIRQIGEMITDGMVIGLLDRAVDVLLLKLGVIKRCYVEKLPLKRFYSVSEKGQSAALILEWQDADDDDPLHPTSSSISSGKCVVNQKLTYFERVTVLLKPFENDALKFNAFLMRPGEEQETRSDSEELESSL